MWLSRTWLLPLLLGLACAQRNDENDASSAFIEEARKLFNHHKSIENMPQAKQVGDMLFEKKSSADSVSQILSGLGSLMSGGQNNQGFDMSMVGSILNVLGSMNNGQANHAKRSMNDAQERNEEHGIDWGSVISMGSAFFQQNANSDMVMGLVPMVLETLGHGSNDADAGDHSGHSWFLPPILENIHVMWDHFSNSELGQTLWKNSGLSKVMAQMSDEHGNIQYEKIMDSFENPTLRRRWIRSLTNFVSEWISHVSDPVNQQRYLSTAQFVGNSFLKSQGFPKSAMFDAQRPADSLSRLANMLARKYLSMNIDSSLYVRPAIAYFQELVSLASEKGFIMSRVNARELSNKLSDTINNDIVSPLLKAYRAHKWATKMPHCASQILCTINEKSQQSDGRDNESRIRSVLLKMASFPAAWTVSNKSGINFWSLYGAIMENEGCIRKYPADCMAFHEEEIRVTTESIHNEL
ncbi:PREDICTED: uncharacterized protein LOC106751149 [Dinoponera quadriceps]|uniref:Uncharacterized protein LOC106751149 n=1 Tax=Dinoponera quadriceps TaxID=609295 RepID=A0A6P3Y969_DINQU|nr:PREDICTED: uncharacterized protein LOC106751149 [Dinoponera quadriceps]